MTPKAPQPDDRGRTPPPPPSSPPPLSAADTTRVATGGEWPALRSSRARTLQSRPELERFRQTLARLMAEKGLTASQLAREIWGSTTDARGYNVARNRDRLTHYLAGTGYPAPQALEKMAQVLGVDPALLAKDESVVRTPRHGASPEGEEQAAAARLGASVAVLTPVGGQPLAHVTLHHAIPMETATKILALYTEALKALDDLAPAPAGLGCYLSRQNPC